MNPTTIAHDARERIVQTAARLFYTQGYHVTGINQIIAEAQVAKASFYAHFPAKEELAVFYLQRTQAELLQELRDFVGTVPQPRPRILTLFGFLSHWMLETDYRGCRSLNLLPEFPDPEHPVRRRIIAHKTALRAYMRELVAQAHHERPIARGVDHTTDRIYLLFEGAIVESKLYRERWPIEVARQAVAELLF